MTVYVGKDGARLLREIEMHDPASATHMLRVAQYAGLIARGLRLGPQAVEECVTVCALHDVGKLLVSGRILRKVGELAPDEMLLARLHVQRGHALLMKSRFPLAAVAAEVALRHHERFDGSGYPDGLRGAAIPLYARIAAVADVFDALTSSRPRRDALGFDLALEYVCRQGGLHFDPDCVDAFAAKEREILDVRRRFPDRAPARLADPAPELRAA